MGTKDRRTNSSLTQRLEDEPYRFDFYQVVRLLEQIDPERNTVGHDGDPRRDAARASAQDAAFQDGRPAVAARDRGV